MATAGKLQCHRCGKMGHTAKNCSRPPDCFRCGQSHYARDCPSAPRPACYKCGRTTHLARDCPTGINCYKCGQTGHFAKDCSQRPRHSRRDEPVVTASQLPPVFCAHCKRRGHTATQCTAGELQDYDDFKDSLNITPDMLLLGNVKRKRPETEDKEEGKKGDKKRMTTQILIVPKQKKGKTTTTAEKEQQTHSTTTDTKAQLTTKGTTEEEGKRGKDDEEEEGGQGGLFALMASYGESEGEEENGNNREENGEVRTTMAEVSGGEGVPIAGPRTPPESTIPSS